MKQKGILFPLEQAEQLREHYMSKCNTEVAEAQQALLPVQQAIRELHKKVGPRSGLSCSCLSPRGALGLALLWREARTFLLFLEF